MNKDITYNGYTAAPSDYECNEGDLALSLNIINEEGHLKPVMMPKKLMKLRNECTLRYIHKVNGISNIIVSYRDGQRTCIARAEDDEPFCMLDVMENIKDINSIGMFLIISTSKKLRYVYYKDGKYNLLSELPELEMRFLLKSELKTERIENVAVTVGQSTTSSTSYVDICSIQITPEFRQYVDGNGTVHYKRYGIPIHIQDGLKENTEYAFLSEFSRNVGRIQGAILFGSVDESIKYWTEEEQENGGGSMDGWERITEFGGGYNKMYLFTSKKNYKKFMISLNWYMESDANNQRNDNKTYIVYLREGLKSQVQGNVIIQNEENFNAVMGFQNKFINSYGTKKNKFVYPFFIRYALRLFDGSHIKISTPILMVPNSGYAPMTTFADNGLLSSFSFFSEIYYSFGNDVDSLWKDLIQGVDVYASEQIYAYEQGMQYDEHEQQMNFFTYNSQEYEKNNEEVLDYTISYINSEGYRQFKKQCLQDVVNKTHTVNEKVVQIARRKDTVERVENLSGFYRIKFIPFEDILSSGEIAPNAKTEEIELKSTKLEMEEGTLSNLKTMPTLEDEMNSNCEYFNAKLFSFNNRLHIFSHSMRYAKPVTPVLQRCTTETDLNVYLSRLTKIKVHIRTEQGTKTVEETYKMNSYSACSKYLIPWFFYPHNGAFQADLYFDSIFENEKKSRIYSIQMKECKLLNGAYFFAGDFVSDLMDYSFIEDDKGTINNIPTIAGTSTNDVCNFTNTICISNTSQPMVFPQAMQNKIGVNEIIGLSTTAKALSQGQFGQFPLYVFSNEGVWALEMNSKGTYDTKNPVTRDVCSNHKSITQLDGAILFQTKRGIMMIEGSQTECISDAINSEYPFNVEMLPKWEKLRQICVDEGMNINTEDVKIVPFSEFINDCSMIYDYVNQRVVLYNNKINYAYILSLKSKKWGMMQCNLSHNINSYPEALAMDKDNYIVDLSNAQDIRKGLFITRPFGIDSQDSFNTIDTIIQRGFFDRTHIKQILYGSNDNIHWYIVWSSNDSRMNAFRGTPFKTYRLAVLTSLGKEESIHNFSLSFNQRRNNKIR